MNARMATARYAYIVVFYFELTFFQESESLESGKTKGGKVAKVKGEIEDKRNPQYIPRKGPFYEHDDRGGETEKKATKETADSAKAADGEEHSAEGGGEKGLKAKKRQMATMKLRSDEMADDEAEAAVSGGAPSAASAAGEQTPTSKTASKEKAQLQQADGTNSPSAETPEKSGDGASGGGSGGSASSPSTGGVAKSASMDDSKTSSSSLETSATRRSKALWDSKGRWSHDKFNVDDQKPKSREELINSYGYDIRDETEAPKLQRRSKYGKGPQKYSGSAGAGGAGGGSSRRTDDDSNGSSFAKRSLRKVIVRTSPRESKTSESEHHHPHHPHQEPMSPREKGLREDEERMASSGKKDTVFSRDSRDNHRDNRDSTRNLPKDRKVISKEANYASSIGSGGRQANNNNNERIGKSSYADSPASSRLHENRVFTNKTGSGSGPAAGSGGRYASTKNTERPPARESRGHSDNGYGYDRQREDRMSRSGGGGGDYHHHQQQNSAYEHRNSRDTEPSSSYSSEQQPHHYSAEKSSKELFTNEDFPELVSAPTKGATTANLTVATSVNAASASASAADQPNPQQHHSSASSNHHQQQQQQPHHHHQQQQQSQSQLARTIRE